MTDKRVIAVIGANFGDEGKGLAVDSFCAGSAQALVVRHNGGAQAGHTVETEDKRFVFHQLSSGSFRGADTLLAKTFLPDLYKLEEEILAFRDVSGFSPRVYADHRARVTVIDDILLNMALETSRGRNRHGSCGMGINEAVLRNEAGFWLTVGKVAGMSAGELASELFRIRREYVIPRLSSLGINDGGEFSDLLSSENVIVNASEGMMTGIGYLTPVNGLSEMTDGREKIVFEGAQGLLLDSENKRFAPHLTSSRTGIKNPLELCRDAGISLNMAVYVMRSYVTRHGAGELPGECEASGLGDIGPDRTNITNRWQGSFRYGRYPSPEELAAAVLEDCDGFDGDVCLFVTHLNETSGMIRFCTGDIPAAELPKHPAFAGRIGKFCCSYSRFGLS